MKGKKLYQILKALSAREMRSFCDFVQSPYFNKNPHLIAFTAHLAELHPSIEEHLFEKKHLPIGLLSDEELTDKKVSYLISNLQQLVEQFLVVERLDSKVHLQEYMCINALREKNLRDIYYPRLLKLHKKLEKPKKYHREQVTLRFMVSDILADLAGNKIKEMETSLQTAIDYSFELFVVNILRYAYASENRQAIQFIEPSNIPLLAELEPYFEELKANNPLIELHYALLRCVRESDQDEPFDELKTLLPNYQHLLGERQLRIIYMSTINASLRKMRANPEKYTQTTLDLYTNGIDSGALLEADRLSEWTFNNTVKLALRADKVDWAEDFVSNYQGFLITNERKNALGLNKAEIAFARGAFHDVLAHLNNVSTKTIRYHVLVNILRIKAFWELQEIQPATAALSAFKVYLSRTRGIAPPLKKSAQNFCQLLHRISVGGSQKKREETEQLISTTPLLIDRQWLAQAFQKENA